MSRAYLLGALHDATERQYTYRLSQKGTEYVEMVASMVRDLGYQAWTYQEGSSRDVHVAEFSKAVVDECRIETPGEKRAYACGYFDAEGSVPHDPDSRFYIYFAQQDKADLQEVKGYLEELEIETGQLHQPSKTEAPEYWRFYVSTSSHDRFAEEIRSRHPRKHRLLREKRRSMP